MNKDNFIANVRNLKDYYNTTYTYEGRTLSDCTALHVADVTIKFSEVVHIVHGTFTGCYNYDELEDAYQFLLYCLYESSWSYNKELVMQCSVGPFRRFSFEQRGDEIIIDLHKHFNNRLEAFKFLYQFVPRLDFAGDTSMPVTLAGVPFSFSFYFKQ